MRGDIDEHWAIRRLLLVRFFDAPSRQVMAATAVLAAAIVVFLAHEQWQSYREAVTRAERDTRNVAILLAEHGSRTFDGIEQTLRAAGRLQGDVARGIYRSRDSVYVHLKTLRGGSQVLAEVGWFDAHGERVATSRQVDPPTASAGDDEFFQVHRRSDSTGIHISLPAHRAGAADLINISLRLDQLDGTFAGVALGTLHPEVFSNLFRSLDLGPGHAAALLRRDGTALAQAADPQAGNAPQDHNDTPFWARLADRGMGTYHTGRLLDEGTRIGSYARLHGAGAGLVVDVSVAAADALSGFRRGFLSASAGAGAGLFVLFAGTVLLVSGLRRRERLQLELADAVAAADTARAEADAARVQAEKSHAKAVEASRAKSAFLAQMSHELRTPLNAVIGFAQMLELDRSNTLTPRQKEYSRDILASGEHLLQLVNEILDLTGIEAGRLPLVFERISVEQKLAGIGDMMRPVAIKAGVTLEVRTPSVPNIHADALRLRQALINLVANAIKYNVRGGSVVLSAAAPSENYVRLLVSDTGRGISVEEQARLFEPFHRLGAEYTAVEGTGLGLALAKTLVEAMAGSIGFTSRVGEGSTFWIEIPIDIHALAVPESSTMTADHSGARLDVSS